MVFKVFKVLKRVSKSRSGLKVWGLGGLPGGSNDREFPDRIGNSWPFNFCSNDRFCPGEKMIVGKKMIV